MRFGPKGAEPGGVRAAETVVAEQGLEVEREPVGRERGHRVLVVRIERLLLLLLLRLGLIVVGGLGEGVDEVGIGVEGGVVVADGRHDGDVAVVGVVVGAGDTGERTVSLIVLESIGGVEALGVDWIVRAGHLGLLLAQMGGPLCLLRGR